MKIFLRTSLVVIFVTATVLGVHPCQPPEERCGDQSMVINEVLAHPDQRYSFVELYNPGERCRDISGWTVSVSGTEVAVLPERSLVPPNGYAPIGGSIEDFARCGVTLFTEFQSATGLPLIGPFDLQLVDENGVLNASARYDPGCGSGRSRAYCPDQATWHCTETLWQCGIGNFATPAAPNDCS